MEDESMKDFAIASGAVDCLLDLPEDHEEKVIEILRVLTTYAKTVNFRQLRKNDCKRT